MSRWSRCSAGPIDHARAERETKALACEIARFRQQTSITNRTAINAKRGMSMREGLEYEWRHGKDAIINEGIAGAGRFSAGAGRHGDFGEI